ILPVTPNDLLSWAEITEITAPARDVESDDHLRARLLSSQSWIAHGGNVADYLDMTSKIDEVGAAQIYPTWNGGGTVKVVILNNNLMPASASLV
ncbi:baseplate J/gp47 family protein, partial [Lactobacillus gasseri]|uniref:baseplate J/gp47 family protein n=1 Tax=Lactobacillus gasseri TaxID=1596 RepID=UPI00254DAB31